MNKEKDTIYATSKPSRSQLTIEMLLAERDRLKAVNTVLLEACKMAAGHWSNTDSPTGTMLRIAIAKATK